MESASLSVRRVGIDTWRENVVYLHRNCPVVRASGFQALSKVLVHANGQTITAVLNVVDDEQIVKTCELGVSEDAFARLQVTEGHSAQVEHAEPPASIAALHRKIAGERLSREELTAVMSDIVAARYSKIELAAFVVATNQFELDREEVRFLTEAMIAVGQRIDWQRDIGRGPVVDKHCIGGIPGNRTSMIIVPIVTAHGMLCPKTSSRAITSPAGPADTMAVLADVELPLARLAARRWGWVDHLAVVPLATPAVLLAIGFVHAYNGPHVAALYDATFDFYDGGAILTTAYAARFLPFGVLLLSAAVRRIPRAQEESALFAARGPAARALRVHLPPLLPAIGSLGCLLFALALRELDVAVVLPAGNETIVRRLSNVVHFGGEDVGGALALLLLLAAVLPPIVGMILRGKRLDSLS